MADGKRGMGEGSGTRDYEPAWPPEGADRPAPRRGGDGKVPQRPQGRREQGSEDREPASREIEDPHPTD